MAATRARTSVRVRGVTYRDPDEARVAADELEFRAEQIAREAREGGNEALADTVQDRALADARRLRDFARELEEHEAGSTEQPDDVPAPSPSPAPARRRPRRTSSTRPTSGARRPRRRSSGGGLLRPARRDVERFGSATGLDEPIGGAADLFMVAIGATLTLVILRFLIATPRGQHSVAGLSSGAARFTRRLLDPADPLWLAHSGADKPLSAAGAGSSSPVSPTRSSSAPAPKGGARPTGQLVGVPGARPGVKVDRAYVSLVVAIQRMFGVTAESGARSPEHNAEVGGAEHSDHIPGNGVAVDFVGTPSAMARLHAWAVRMGFPYVEPMAQTKDRPHVHISFWSRNRR